MKAKIKTKKFIDNREKLQDIIPMDTPLCIFIEPTDKCNFKCRFCPHVYPDVIKNTKGRNHGNMDFNLYKKIIDDIKEFNNNVKQLVLYKDGEPLLHPKFPEMIEYAKKSNKFNNILTTTNAYLLNESIALKIIDAGLDRINISIEGMNSKQYKEVANVDIDFKKIIKNVEYFYKHKKQCEVSVKIPGNFLSEEDKKEFYNIFGDISDLIFVENLVFTWPNFDHNGIIFDPILTNIYDKVVNKIVCPQIFFSFAIGSNGDVLACCVDWERKLVIGNVNNSSVKEIWNSKDMYDLQVMFLEKKKNEHPYCSTCNAPSYGMLDNIDPYAEEILNKIQTRPDQTRPDQTRPDQTRPDQTRPDLILIYVAVTYIFIIIQNIKNYNLCCNIKLVESGLDRINILLMVFLMKQIQFPLKSLIYNLIKYNKE